MSSDSKLDQICKTYEENKLKNVNLGSGTPTDIVSKLKPTKEEIKKFSKVLSRYYERDFEVYLARYLTALMQVCKAKKIILEPDIVLSSVGYQLEGKDVLIIGNVGNSAFMYAHDCKINIKGYAGSWLGYIADNCSIKVDHAGPHNGELATNCMIQEKINTKNGTTFIIGDLKKNKLLQFLKNT